MSETKERRGPGGQLLGPRRTDDWLKWRAARDKRIAKPRRLKRENVDDDAKREPPP